jgi:hypothetical protein
MAKPERTLGERLQSLPKHWLYGVLLIVTTVPLFLGDKIPVPNQPVQSSRDLFAKLNSIPEGSTILIASDWTKSTRGESQGQFKALLRILMRRKIKFAVYATADGQAPQVAKDTIRIINEERTAAGEAPYRRWEDWVSLGYFPNAEGTANAIANNLRTWLAGRRDSATAGGMKDVFQSPVLQNVNAVGDLPLLIVVTASKTSNITIQRLSGKVPLALMVTGVMGPESQIYYSSGQVMGLSAGLKGVYDIETLMAETWPGAKNADNGTLYYPTLHFALALLILTVVIGNVAMVLTRKGSR